MPSLDRKRSLTQRIEKNSRKKLVVQDDMNLNKERHFEELDQGSPDKKKIKISNLLNNKYGKLSNAWNHEGAQSVRIKSS